MKLSRWQKGRQPATEQIQKLTLWSRWGFDVHILRASKGAVVSKHVDPVEGKEHYRTNITLAGDWLFELYDAWSDTPYTMRHCVYLDRHKFRPDLEYHGARFLFDTTILSLGCARGSGDGFWSTRAGLVLRRIAWTLSFIPVFILALVFGVVGVVLGMVWMGLWWIAGARREHDELIRWSWDAAENMWYWWKRLLNVFPPE